MFQSLNLSVKKERGKEKEGHKEGWKGRLQCLVMSFAHSNTYSHLVYSGVLNKSQTR
jgi:hypothetical protein